jgi:hypothetical protein
LPAGFEIDSADREAYSPVLLVWKPINDKGVSPHPYGITDGEPLASDVRGLKTVLDVKAFKSFELDNLKLENIVQVHLIQPKVCTRYQGMFLEFTGVPAAREAYLCWKSDPKKSGWTIEFGNDPRNEQDGTYGPLTYPTIAGHTNKEVGQRWNGSPSKEKKQQPEKSTPLTEKRQQLEKANVSTYPFKKGDWICPNRSCGFHNFARYDNCGKCRTKRSVSRFPEVSPWKQGLERKGNDKKGSPPKAEDINSKHKDTCAGKEDTHNHWIGNRETEKARSPSNDDKGKRENTNVGAVFEDLIEFSEDDSEPMANSSDERFESLARDSGDHAIEGQNGSASTAGSDSPSIQHDEPQAPSAVTPPDALLESFEVQKDTPQVNHDQPENGSHSVPMAENNGEGHGTGGLSE